MNIFITGGSGFLGQRLIRRLRQEDHVVTALSRSPASDKLLQQLGARTVSGSLDTITNWASALAHQDVVIHAASPIEVWGEWEAFERDITRASADVYRACVRAKVRRFIYISSESVVQDKSPLLDIDESFPYPVEPNSYYGKAKMQVEQALLASDAPVERIILRPTFIWGQGGPQLDKVVDKVRAKQFMWVDHGDVSMEMVHVDNVVEAVRLALTKGRPQQVYWVTDDRPMPAGEFLGALIKARGVPVPEASLPSGLVRPLASLVEGLWRLLGLRSVPPLSRFQLDFIALPRRYNLAKIKRDMGYRPVRSFEQGIMEMGG